MEKFNDLICHLMAIEGCCKNIHYNVPDYSIHLFSDRVQDDLSDFVDELKETCLLAKGYNVLDSSEYFLLASKLIPNGINLKELKTLLIDTLDVLEKINKITIGDGDVLGRIGANLQNSLGIIAILEKK